MAIEIDRKINVRSPYFVEVVDEYLGVVTPQPEPEPEPEPDGTDGFYYRLTRCSDLSLFFSISYPAQPFSSFERVEDSSGISYVISGSREDEPVGVKKTITTTGLTGCPEVEVPEIPEPTTVNLFCGLQTAVPRTVGINKYRIDGADREAGTFQYRITGVKTPIKHRVYTEGETPPAYVTIGLDNWAVQWLAATGEDASSLSPAGSYTDGVSTGDVIHITSAAEAGKNVIVEIFSPITTISTMSMFAISCPDIEAAPAPVDSGFVTVLTLQATQDIHKGSYGSPATTNDVMVVLNGLLYSMPNVKNGSGLRLILDDVSPNYTVLDNNFPYSGNYSSSREWSYNEGTGAKQMIPQEVSSTGVNSGTNTLIITARENVNFKFALKIAQHPVQIINGAKVIRHKGDGQESTGGVSSFNGLTTGFMLGESNSQSSEETLTLKFSGVNTGTLVSESAEYSHEIFTSWGDSYGIDADNVLPQFGVGTIS